MERHARPVVATAQTVAETAEVLRLSRWKRRRQKVPRVQQVGR